MWKDELLKVGSVCIEVRQTLGGAGVGTAETAHWMEVEMSGKEAVGGLSSGAPGGAAAAGVRVPAQRH